VLALIEKERYRLDILPDLVNYVNFQVEERKYNLEANLVILKLYQFNPKMFDVDVAGKILALAIMNMPSTDFILCSALMPEFLPQERITQLIAMGEALEISNFKQFWALRNGTIGNFLDIIPNFDESVRNFILNIVTITYQSIGKELLAEWVNMSLSALSTFVSEQPGWSQSGDIIHFPLNEENQAKPKKLVEPINVEQMRKILSSVVH